MMKRYGVLLVWFYLLAGCRAEGGASPAMTMSLMRSAEWTHTIPVDAGTPKTPAAVATTPSSATSSPTPAVTSTPTSIDFPGITPVGTPQKHASSITLKNVGSLHEIARLSNGSFYDAQWSPDGKSLAVARPMGIEFYDAVTGKLSGTYGFREGRMIRFTPDGEYLAISTGDAVWLARMAGGEIERTFTTGMPGIQFMSISPDGKLLVLAGHFGDDMRHDQRSLIEVWELKSGKLALQYKEDGSWYLGHVQFSSDSKRILYVYAGGMGTIGMGFTVIHAATGSVEISADGSQFADYLPDGRVLACREDGLWMTYGASGKPEMHAMSIPCASFMISRDGKRIAIESENKVLIWDFVNQRELAWIEASWIADAAFSPDGRYILLGRDYFTKEKFDADTGESCWSISSSVAGYDMSFLFSAPAGWEEVKAPFLVTSNPSDELSLWSVGENRRLKVFPLSAVLSSYLHKLMVAPDGRTVLFSSDWGREVWIYRIESEKPSHILSCEEKREFYMLPSMEFSADGRSLLIQCPGEAFVLNTAEWKVVNRISANDGVAHHFRGDGKLLGMETTSAGIGVWDALTGENLALFQPGSAPSAIRGELIFGNIVFNSEYFSATELNNELGMIIWDWNHPQTPIRYTGYNGEYHIAYSPPLIEFNEVIFHPYENLLALSYRGDEKIVLINAETGWTVRTFDPVCGGDVQNLDFSRDGRYLAAACPNGLVWVYGIKDL